ncbi:GrpB family protein [Bradyrhizobium elkanii]|uniref:GrpB family protein n=1 Tax=Bradyrhizobium elkanii TaxID=29448 RepID=UPI0035122D79
MEKYGAGPIVVLDYDPNWPAMFETERARIEHALGSLVLAIEHVGSTAVSGLAVEADHRPDGRCPQPRGGTGTLHQVD